MLQALFILFALLAGVAVALQTGVNSQLRFCLNNPLQAGFVSFAVGTLALAIVALPQGTRWNFGEIIGFPWWVWTGGLLGAFFVASTVALVPRLGVALTFSLIIAGQMLITLVIDHFGFLDVPVKAVNLPRLLGVTFITVGVILIRKF